MEELSKKLDAIQRHNQGLRKDNQGLREDNQKLIGQNVELKNELAALKEFIHSFTTKFEDMEGKFNKLVEPQIDGDESCDSGLNNINITEREDNNKNNDFVENDTSLLNATLKSPNNLDDVKFNVENCPFNKCLKDKDRPITRNPKSNLIRVYSRNQLTACKHNKPKFYESRRRNKNHSNKNKRSGLYEKNINNYKNYKIKRNYNNNDNHRFGLTTINSHKSNMGHNNKNYNKGHNCKKYNYGRNNKNYNFGRNINNNHNYNMGRKNNHYFKKGRLKNNYNHRNPFKEKIYKFLADIKSKAAPPLN